MSVPCVAFPHAAPRGRGTTHETSKPIQISQKRQIHRIRCESDTGLKKSDVTPKLGIEAVFVCKSSRLIIFIKSAKIIFRDLSGFYRTYARALRARAYVRCGSAAFLLRQRLAERALFRRAAEACPGVLGPPDGLRVAVQGASVADPCGPLLLRAVSGPCTAPGTQAGCTGPQRPARPAAGANAWGLPRRRAVWSPKSGASRL